MFVYGRIWVKKDSKSYLGLGRVALLDGVQKSGSIARSAKNMRMSYKAAWDDIKAMNELSEKPLVFSATGGKSGGGTKLSDEGEMAIESYRALNDAKEAFCRYFDNVENLGELKSRAQKLHEAIRQLD